MSTKIGLWFEEFIYPNLEKKIPDIGKLTRLFCLMKFKLSDGTLGKTRQAIVDTGAPISVIPIAFWRESVVNILAEHEIYGINPREECSVPMLVGYIKCMLVDENGNKTSEFEILSYFSLTNKIPLIIGFKGLLSNFNICLNQRNNVAFMEVMK